MDSQERILVYVNPTGELGIRSRIDPRCAQLALKYELAERLKRYHQEYDQSLMLVFLIKGQFTHPITFGADTGNLDIRIEKIHDIGNRHEMTREEMDYTIALLNSCVPGISLQSDE